jgi:hypothetical protein
MAEIKITEMPELLPFDSYTEGAGVEPDDYLPIIDTSATTGPLKNKKVAVSTLFENILSPDDLIDTALSGSPTAPTPGLTSNSNSIATTAFVQNKLNNLSLELDDLSDVTIATTPTANQTLLYNTTLNQFVPGTLTSSLVNLTDVNVATPSATNNNFLIGWDNTSSKFVFIAKPGTAANNLVQLDATSRLPAVDGSQLTNLPTQSSLTTKGDLNTYSTVNTRLPIGTNNQILMAESTEATGLKWKTFSSTDFNLSQGVNSTSINLKTVGAKTQIGPLEVETNLSPLDNEFLVYNLTNTRFESTDPTGTNVGNIVKLINVGGNAALPAVDGSQLVNLPSSGTPSPLTTKGDLYGFGTANDRLPVGANNLVLTADSTAALGIAWKAPVSPDTQSFSTIQTSSFTLFDSFHSNLIRVNTASGNVTITLSNSVRAGFQATIFNVGGNNVIISPGAQTILARGLNLINPNSSFVITYDAATLTWYAIGDLS